MQRKPRPPWSLAPAQDNQKERPISRLRQMLCVAVPQIPAPLPFDGHYVHQTWRSLLSSFLSIAVLGLMVWFEPGWSRPIFHDFSDTF